MLRLLLDANLSQRITAEIRRHRPECAITDLHEWRSGQYLEERDDARILAGAGGEGLTLVTRDVHSLAPLVTGLERAGQSHAGVNFLTRDAFPEGNVGAVVRSLIQLWERDHNEDFHNTVTYLEPPLAGAL